MLLYPTIEDVAILIIGGYVITEYAILYYKMLLQFLNKAKDPSKYLYKKVRLSANKIINPLIIRTKVRTVGEFAEVGIWMKVTNVHSSTLHAKIHHLAKRIMREVPYVIRVSVVVVVLKPRGLKRPTSPSLMLKKECLTYTR